MGRRKIVIAEEPRVEEVSRPDPPAAGVDTKGGPASQNAPRPEPATQGSGTWADATDKMDVDKY